MNTHALLNCIVSSCITQSRFADTYRLKVEGGNFAQFWDARATARSVNSAVEENAVCFAVEYTS